MEGVENIMQQRVGFRLQFGESTDVEQEFVGHRPLLGVDVHEQPAFLCARQPIVDDNRHAHRGFGELEAEDAMLPVDDEKGFRVLAEGEGAFVLVIGEMRARLRREHDGAGNRAQARVDVTRNRSCASLVEQALEAVSRIFGPSLDRASLGEKIARQHERIETMLALCDDQGALGNCFDLGGVARAGGGELGVLGQGVGIGQIAYGVPIHYRDPIEART